MRFHHKMLKFLLFRFPTLKIIIPVTLGKNRKLGKRKNKNQYNKILFCPNYMQLRTSELWHITVTQC